MAGGAAAVPFHFIALIGGARQQAEIVNLLTYYWEQPLAAFINGLFLLYNPPLLDILPMYILFMLTSAPLSDAWPSRAAGR